MRRSFIPFPLIRFSSFPTYPFSFPSQYLSLHCIVFTVMYVRLLGTIIGRQAGRQENRQAGRRAGRQAGRQAGRHENRSEELATRVVLPGVRRCQEEQQRAATLPWRGRRGGSAVPGPGSTEAGG